MERIRPDRYRRTTPDQSGGLISDHFFFNPWFPIFVSLNASGLNRLANISVFLLLLFSVVLLHSMIPHDHHGEDLMQACSMTCDGHGVDHHGEKGEAYDSEKSNVPLHCHAFNALVFVKANQFDIPSASFLHLQALFTSEYEQVEARLTLCEAYVPDPPDLRVSGYFPEPRSPRGPPACG